MKNIGPIYNKIHWYHNHLGKITVNLGNTKNTHKRITGVLVQSEPGHSTNEIKVGHRKHKKIFS